MCLSQYKQVLLHLWSYLASPTSRLAPGSFLACAAALALKALFISFMSLECLLQNMKLAEGHIAASEDGVFLGYQTV